MQGSSLSPILHPAAQVLASLPTPLVYGGGAALGVLITVLLATWVWPSAATRADQQGATSRQSPSSTATDDATVAADATSSIREADALVDSQEPENRTGSTAPDEDETTEFAKERGQVSSTQERPATTTDSLSTGQKPVPSKNIDQRTQSTGPILDATGNGRSRRHSAGRFSTQSRRSRTVTNRLSMRREVRRHLIDPFQLETGVDPIALDPSWGLVKADLSLNGVSADAGYELIYLNLQPAPVSYEAIDSPVEFTASTLLRRLVRDALAASSTETQTCGDHTTRDHRQGTRNNRRPREQSHHRHINDGQHIRDSATGEPGQQQPVETARGIEQRPTPSRRERPPRDRDLDPHESLHPSTTPEPNSWPHESAEDPATPSSTANDLPLETISRDRPLIDTSPRFDGLPHLENRIDDPVLDSPHIAEPGEELTGNTTEPKQQADQCSEPVGLRPLPRWEPPEFEPPTLAMDDDSIPGEHTIEAATPSRELDNPFAEMRQGLDAISVGNVLEEPSSQEMDLRWEDESLDVATAIFGGETGEAVNDMEFLPGLAADDDTMPTWDNMDECQEGVFGTDLPL